MKKKSSSCFCRDWPLVGKYLSSPLPVLSFSKTRHYWDIMYPAWTFWEGGPALTIYPNGLGRWDKYMLSLAQACSYKPNLNQFQSRP